MAKARCRICFVENVRMHPISNTYLQETYERLSEMPLKSKDDRPILLCYICFKRLQHCHRLHLNCIRSENLLAQVPEKDLIPLPNHLGKSQITHTTFTESSNDDVKLEVEDYVDVEVKQENKEDTEAPCYDTYDNTRTSDSDDNIPLKVIKNESERKLRRKKRNRLRKRDDDIKKTFQIDAHKIILSREEQLSNLVARSTSQNYTKSPYRCDMCFKGFVDLKAFENHKMKHDESSGPHACDICHMRYRSTQHLRTHVITAHSRLFKCNKCEHTSHTANQARVHEKWHNGFTYECQLCSHTFRKPTSYLSHMRKRHPTEHVCNICGESFVGQHGLQMHKSKTHKNDRLKESIEEPTTDRFCKDCDILFYNRDAWKRHILCSIKHTLKSKTSTECGICGWSGTNTALTNHMREHSRSLKKRPRTTHVPERSHCRCPQCGVNFLSRGKLQAHINRIHLGMKYNKDIVCEVCGKHCTSNATLKYHQRTHTGERPYSCSTCVKQFSDSNQLRIHIRTHTGEKPYICAACGKRFTQKPALNRHYRVHTGDKPYPCTYCTRTFSQSNSLKLHIRTVHLKLPVNNRKRSKKTADNTLKNGD